MQTSSPFYPYCVDVFKQAPLFSDLPDEQIASLLHGFRRETWKKQSRIEVNTIERFFVVTRGRVELVKTNYAMGRDLTLFLLHPGDVFDLVTLLDGAPHDLTPMALDQVDLLSVPLASMREWQVTHPVFNQKLLPYLGRQMRALEELGADLAFHDTVTRLGRLLTHHLLPSHQPLSPNSSQIPLVHDLSHEVLARMIGSVRVVVSRHIQAWKKDGTVSSKRKHLAILNLKGLESHCDSIEASLHTRKR